MCQSDFVVQVLTDANLGKESFVRTFLQGWMELPREIRPERFDRGEPVRRRIADEGIDTAVKLWVESQQPLMFQRGKKHKFIADIGWRKEKGQDPRQYPWRCTIWLNGSASDDLVTQLLELLITHFQAAFGFVTSADDQKRKHFVSFQDRVGIVEKFVGTDVLETLPGVYWKTFFGKGTLERLDQQAVQKVGASCKPLGSGCLVTAYEGSNLIGTDDARATEDRIAESLGKNKFFDKSMFDLNTLRMTQADAAALEQAVADKKRQG